MHQLLYKDFTIKARCEDLSTIEEILHQQHARYLGADHQKDTYFHVERGKLKYRQGTIENVIMHYERILKNNMQMTRVYRYDKNPSPEEVQELYNTRTVIGVVEKLRKIYFVDNVKVHLDEVPDGKHIVEIEAQAEFGEKPLNELRKQCRSFMELLGITASDILNKGYLQ